MTITLDNKKSLSELAYVVDSTNTIELVLKEVLTKYMGLTGARADFFSRIFLHNSVVGLAQKFKVLHHIVAAQGWPTLDLKHFHNVLSIRNSFAHSDTASFAVSVEIREDGNHSSSEPYQLVDSLSSSGKYEELKRKDALARFQTSAIAVHEYLLSLANNYAVQCGQAVAPADPPTSGVPTEGWVP